METNTKMDLADSDNKYLWYIATTYSGREDSVVDDLISKIKALDLDQFVKAIKVVKVKKIIEHVYDHNNPPPAHMRNTKNIRWVTDKPGIYKKVETKIVNKFPGYIFIKMDLNDKVWLAIRNSFYVTGFVGSSGKGAKPIPISDNDLKSLRDTLENNKPMEEEKQTIEAKTNIYDETQDAKIHEQIEQLNEQTDSVDPQAEVEDIIELPFKVGQKVKILDGSFKDTDATVLAVDNKKGKVFIKYKFMENELTGEVNPESIALNEPVNDDDDFSSDNETDVPDEDETQA